ncbi:MAG: Lrp/AsnC family transcriptional regulator [Nanoarchaeota archaeon]
MLKEKDLLLMSFFRKNSRMPLTHISRKTNIPVSTIFDKLKEYESKLIEKHTTLINFRKLGFDIKVSILLKVENAEKYTLQDYLQKDERVNSIFKINNGYDFLIEAIFRDIKEMNEFLEGLEQFSIIEKREFFVLEDIKREDFLTMRTPFLLRENTLFGTK